MPVRLSFAAIGDSNETATATESSLLLGWGIQFVSFKRHARFAQNDMRSQRTGVRGVYSFM